jgi:hypothetical protein
MKAVKDMKIKLSDNWLKAKSTCSSVFLLLFIASLLLGDHSEVLASILTLEIVQFISTV